MIYIQLGCKSNRKEKKRTFAAYYFCVIFI